MVIFDNMPSVLPHIKAGKLRGAGCDDRERARTSFRTLPTVADTVKGYEASAWFGMGVPVKTPPEIIAMLNKAINEALADPKIKARLAELGGVADGRHARRLRQDRRVGNREVAQGGRALRRFCRIDRA